jgi:hypothetical protein
MSHQPPAAGTPPFDYGALPEADRDRLRQHAEAIYAARKRAASLLDVGRRLLDAKRRLGHGRFGDWVRAEFAWSERTAQRWMAVARRLKSVKVSDLEAVSPTVLYGLASPSTPPAVRADVLEAARRGEPVTPQRYEVIREVVQPGRMVHATVTSSVMQPPQKLTATVYAVEARPHGPGANRLPSTTARGSKASFRTRPTCPGSRNCWPGW